MRSRNSISITKSILPTLFASLVGGTAIVSFVSHDALAYFGGKVETDNAELKQQPRPDAPTVKSLPRGTTFNASDKPTNGYYYIRTATDLGWIDGASIGRPSANAAPEQSPQTQQAPAPRTNPQQRGQPVQQRKRPTRKRSRPASFFMAKLHGDYNIFSFSELNTATSSTSFGNAIGFGGELMWFFDPLTAVGIRLDSISQKISANDTSASATYQTYDFSLSTFAFMVGAERILWEDGDYYIAGNGYLGLASSSLSINATGTSSSAAFDFSGKPITLLALVEGGWKINRTFSLYGELGYRLLNSSNVAPTGNTATTGTIVPATVSLNFSGPVIGIGVNARF